MTTAQAFEAHPCPFKDAKSTYRDNHVFRTTGIKSTTVTQKWTDKQLVAPQKQNE
jgi:hypothetical protein